MAPQMPAACLGFGQQGVDGCGQTGCHLIEGLVPLIRRDPALRHINVLRRGAHLPGIKRQREGQIGAHPVKVIGGSNDHAVDARFLGEDLRLLGILAQPGAEG